MEFSTARSGRWRWRPAAAAHLRLSSPGRHGQASSVPAADVAVQLPSAPQLGVPRTFLWCGPVAGFYTAPLERNAMQLEHNTENAAGGGVLVSVRLPGLKSAACIEIGCFDGSQLVVSAPGFATLEVDVGFDFDADLIHVKYSKRTCTLQATVPALPLAAAATAAEAEAAAEAAAEAPPSLTSAFCTCAQGCSTSAPDRPSAARCLTRGWSSRTAWLPLRTAPACTPQRPARCALEGRKGKRSARSRCGAAPGPSWC